jgi:hypothetical protein
MFVDTTSGKLVLGCDCTAWWASKTVAESAPHFSKEDGYAHTAATDLFYGACIIVAYGDTMVLCSIPPRVIAR